MHLAVSNQSLFAIWSSEEEGEGEIFCVRSTNNGTSFGKVTAISGSIDSFNSDISTSANNIYIVWAAAGYNEENGEYFRVVLTRGCS